MVHALMQGLCVLMSACSRMFTMPAWHEDGLQLRWPDWATATRIAYGSSMVYSWFSDEDAV